MRKNLTLISLFIVFIVNGQSHRDSLNVLNYTINLDISNIGSSSISGFTKIEAIAKFDITNIYLDLYKLTTDSVFINDKMVDFLQNDTILKLNNSGVLSGEQVSIEVYYHGKPQKDSQWGGFYFTNGFAFNMGVGMGSYPHGIGRFWYPCLDSFTDKATYDYYIKASAQNRAVCSGIFIDKTVDADEKPIYHWRLNQPIPTYLSSVAVGPYIKISDSYSGIEKEIPIEIYTAKSDSLGATKTFSKLKETMAAFENLFGAYQWDRVGYVTVPFSGGAMEHATNISFTNNSLTGSLSDETLAAHELAHSWFGNQVTTATSEDMWINEGWATYCEVLFKENVYSYQTAMNQVLSTHVFVIERAHVADGDYFPLNKIPHHITYGKTVYDKGGDVVHSLRGYLGDSLFFKGVKYFLDKKKFGNITSFELEQLLTEGTGIDMSGFFNNWVYQTGFPHYSVDSFYTKNLQTSVALRQKLNHRETFGVKHRIPLTFMDNNWNRFDTTLQFDGENETVTFKNTFSPTAVFTDLHHTLNDATTHDAKVIKSTGFTTFNDCDFKLNTHNIKDSALVQVIYNYVLPDDIKNEIPGVTISNYHYWKIEAITPNDFMADGKFYYYFSQNTNPDQNYSLGVNDTVVLLYRTNAAYNWMVVKKGWAAKLPVGDITKDNIKPGEYAIGYWDGETPIGVLDSKYENTPLIFPIPSADKLNIKWQKNFSGPVTIFDQTGRKLFFKNLTEVTSISIPLQTYSSGVYYISFNSKKESAEKFVVL